LLYSKSLPSTPKEQHKTKNNVQQYTYEKYYALQLYLLQSVSVK